MTSRGFQVDVEVTFGQAQFGIQEQHPYIGLDGGLTADGITFVDQPIHQRTARPAHRRCCHAPQRYKEAGQT
ncbi:hypothetical protein MSZK_60320 [Mycobacterium sp. shizuoka-1]|nr:hypothetical protein MSZK_60320 [Mycobacterium sp. shizuoka-1]